MSYAYQAPATGKSIVITIKDATTGLGKTGLAFNTSGLQLAYTRDHAAPVAIALVTQTVLGAWASGGFVELDATLSPGDYRLDLPNAALIAGAEAVRVKWSGAGTFDDYEPIDLLPFDPRTADKDGYTLSTAGNNAVATAVAAPSAVAIRTEIDSNSTRLSSAATALSNIATAVANFTNLSALANLIGPAVLEIPDSSSKAYQFKLVIKSIQGIAEALDASPTITVVNAAGTDRSGGLSSITNPSTGLYLFTYTVAAGATEEGLQFAATGAVGGSPRRADAGVSIVDYDTMTAISGIATNVTTLLGRVGTPSSGTIASGVAAIPTTAAPTAVAIRTEIDSNSTRLAAIDSRLPAAPANQTVLASAIAAVQSSVNALAGMGAGLTPQDVQDAATLAIISKMNDLADALLDRNMALGTDTGTETVRTVRQALRALRNKQTATAVYKEDDASVSWTQALQTDPNAVPVIGMNPTGGG